MFKVKKTYAPFSELDLFEALYYSDQKVIKVGNFIVIHRFYDADRATGAKKERPNWDDTFKEVKAKHSGQNIGVMYCGPKPIAFALKVSCGNMTDLTGDYPTRFVLHKENF